MDNKQSHNTLELALQTLITARCKRAYIHDLSNGLQGIYGSFEVIKRLLVAPPASALTAVEKSIDMFRRSIANYEAGLKQSVDTLIPEPCDRTTVSLDELLRSMVAFLNGDAAAHGVSLSVAVDRNLYVVANPHALRLTLVSLLLDSIDSMPLGGQTHVEAKPDTANVVIEITTKPSRGTIARNIATAWDLDLDSAPPYRGLVYPVARNLVRADEGTIELAKHNEGLKVSLLFPTTKAA
jgi:C4-dicarboxylate-specific signal transduction histidine kinase